MEHGFARRGSLVAIALSTVLLAAVMLICIPQGQAQAVEADTSAASSQVTLHQFGDNDASSVQETAETLANAPKQTKAYKAKYGLLAKNGVLYPCNKKGKKLGKVWKNGSTVRTIFVASNVKNVKKLYYGMKYYCAGSVKAKVGKVKFLLNKKKKSAVRKISTDFMKDHQYLKAVVNLDKTKVKTIGANAFCNTKISSVSLPKTVTSIGKYAFYGCSKLTKVKGLDKTKISTIPEATFAKSGVASIAFPTTLKSIGDYAFSTCKSLKSIALPKSCTKIGYSAFNSCGNLASVKLPATTVVSAMPYAFSATKMDGSSPTGRFYVPASLVGAYKADSNWGYYTNCIVAL